MQPLDLNQLRGNLIRQEETIIFALIERAQFKQNLRIYQPNTVPLPDFDGCFTDYLLWETEKIHARVRRYTSPDEHPFFDQLPAPILPPFQYAQQIRETDISINDQVMDCYKTHIIPLICTPGDDDNYGSSATCDVAALQALSKRVHYGKFIAEAKFQRARDCYIPLIQNRDTEGLLKELRDAAVEKKLLKRVQQKAAAYGQDIGDDQCHPLYKIQPDVIAAIYRDWIIPMTIDVEIAYLLVRYP